MGLGWVDTQLGEEGTSCTLVKQNGTKQLYLGQQVVYGTPEGSDYYNIQYNIRLNHRVKKLGVERPSCPHSLVLCNQPY
jgi:hypothetical protein